MSRSQTEDKSLNGFQDPVLSTTTAVPRAGSFRWDLLFVLNGAQFRTCEIAGITEKPNAYVDSYLRRMRKDGLVTREGYFWILSESGASCLSYLKTVDRYRYRYRHYLDTTTTQHQHSLNTQKPKKLKQTPLLPFLAKFPLPDTQKKVVEVLVDHYDKTGSKFLAPRDQYELSEMVQLDNKILQDVLRNLWQNNIIYKIPVDGVTKIGLKDNFIDRLLQNEKHEAAQQGSQYPSSSQRESGFEK